MKVYFVFIALFSLNAHALIYGKKTNSKEFPFVVKIKETSWGGECTGTKIGPYQFITAAHCSSGSDGLVKFSFFHNKKKYKMQAMKFVHPSWINFLEKICVKCDGSDLPENDDPLKVDIALYVTKDESPEIPWVDINFSIHDTNETIPATLVGFGCTQNIFPEGESSLSELRYNEAYLAPFNSLTHKGSLYLGNEKLASNSNWITKAYKMTNSTPALCHGDSGGPLLVVNNSGEWNIIGVAHNYTFTGNYEEGIPMTNLHSRLDDFNFHGTGFWIRSHWNYNF